jgi:hypothetical protein
MVAYFLACVDAKRSIHRLALVLMTVAIFLPGCADHRELDAQKKEDKAAAAAAAKDTATISDARCKSFGFQPGTPSYTKCRKDFDNELDVGQ